MTVLVTGATGRLGANVVHRLAATGMTIRALVRPGARRVDKIASVPSVEIVEGDLCNQELLDRACRGVSHVVHLAAQMVRGATPVDEFYDVNTLATVRLLEAVVRNSPGIERFILASTDSVYRPGDPPGLPLHESMAVSPADYYGTAKLLSETVLKNRGYQFGLPFTVLRFGTILSPEQSDTIYRLGFLRGWLRTQQSLGCDSTLWPLFLGQPNLAEIVDKVVGDASEGSALGIVGPDGPWALSAVDVRDAAEAIRRSIAESGAAGETLNIAGRTPICSTEGSSVVSEIFGVDRVVVELPFTWRVEMSVELARERLGFESVYSYRDTVLAGVSPSDLRSDTARYVPVQDEGGVFDQLSGTAT